MELNKKGYPIWKDSKKLVHKTQVENHILKRRLRNNEVIHHVDGDKLNYDISNLVVLSRENHNKIERGLWRYQNVMLIHFLVIFSSYVFLVAYLRSKYLYLIVLTLFLLLIALIIPLFPKTLRKLLFKIGAIRKNKIIPKTL